MPFGQHFLNAIKHRRHRAGTSVTHLPHYQPTIPSRLLLLYRGDVLLHFGEVIQHLGTLIERL